ncbi:MULTISPECIES: aldo/keto reductase [unclassified Actinomyces]|uniref:aldo/keto reductase n=1 Tax=unclassified Actinomyces TaxID=2609248 RepID=UPI0013A6E130|nr:MULTISPECIES: aldo/keto reductase [unclassified Actinomyces]MBW3069658.1 aldo/keto reductase [Actinomyces sp. 594]NDR54430.1 aldo/keto reductase [Actinomyces sp. 565]
METRPLPALNRDISTVGIGTWQLGTDWGEVTAEDATATLQAALDAGVTFIDTADVYGDGRSEQLVGAFTAAHPEAGLTVATKMGRRVEQLPENYTRDAFLAWNDRSRQNLGVDTLDLVQLHCPPSEVISAEHTWDWLEEMVGAGRIRAYGVSVETCAQALEAMRRPGCASVQIILNVFRRKPLEQVLPTAQATSTAIIARVPLASGLLSGRYREDTTFPASDHRNYNRDGSAFDIGETFSGVPFDVGVKAAQEFTSLCRELGPAGATPAQVALRWILDQPGVTTVIPGARSAEQARANAAAAALEPLSDQLHAALADLYDRRIRTHVHDRW